MRITPSPAGVLEQVQKENTMEPNTISTQRRRLLIAGPIVVTAGVAVPAIAFAGQGVDDQASNANRFEATASAQGDMLIVSGRILGMDRQPLAGATVEAWHTHANTHRATATTDADGRFMFATTAPALHAGRVPNLSYRVSRDDRTLSEQQLYFTRESGFTGERISQWQRDDGGVWRATFGLTFT
jgi:protocatechuate 3,4-dioxygenase beta subunit